MTGYIQKGKATIKIESLKSQVRATITRPNMKGPIIIIGPKNMLKNMLKMLDKIR